MPEEKISLNKYISAAGYCSRREADRLIEQGRVAINGKKAKAAARVSASDKIHIDDELLKVKSTAKENQFIIAFNKPLNITSTTDEKDRTNIIMPTSSRHRRWQMLAHWTRLGCPACCD